MPTIEYGRPSAFSDIQGGIIRQDADWWDDEKPTWVTITTTVLNAGTGAGSVTFRIGVLRPGAEEVESWPVSTGWVRVPGIFETPEGTKTLPLTLTYEVQNNEKQHLIAELFTEDGTFQTSASLTVNSYTTPLEPPLPPPAVEKPEIRSSSIRFSVT